MVFFVAKYRTSTIQLFGKNESYQLVREGQQGQRPAMTGPAKHTLIEPVCAADEEDKVLNAAVGPRLDELRESF